MGRSLTRAAITLRGLAYIQVTFYTSKYPVCPEPQLSWLLSKVSVCFVHLPSVISGMEKPFTDLRVCVCVCVSVCVCVCVCVRVFVISGKVRAPVDLTERVAESGGHLLSWRSPYPVSSNITGTLVYQLQYRRYMHDWTVSTNTHTHTVHCQKKKIKYSASSTQNAYILNGLICTLKDIIAYWVWIFPPNQHFRMISVIHSFNQKIQFFRILLILNKLLKDSVCYCIYSYSYWNNRFKWVKCQ